MTNTNIGLMGAVLFDSLCYIINAYTILDVVYFRNIENNPYFMYYCIKLKV